MKNWLKYLFLFWVLIFSTGIAVAQYVTIGTANGTTAFLMRTYMEDVKSQLTFSNNDLISGANILNVGDTIYSIGWNVQSVGGQAMYNANMNIIESGSATSVWAGTLSPILGWNDILLDVPYVRSGTGNLIIEYCFDNCEWTSTTDVYRTQTPTNTFSYRTGDNFNGCSYIPNNNTVNRPNTRFGLSVPGAIYSQDTICLGTSVALSSSSILTFSPSISGFTYKGLNNGSYYFLSNSSKEWLEADLICRQKGGHLVHINNVTENTYVYNIRQSIGSKIHIGLYQNCNSSSFSEPSGGWQWTDGTPLSYSSWNSTTAPVFGNYDEPNNSGGESYAEMWSNGSPAQGVWNDMSKGVTNRYVLEIEETYLWNTGATTSSITVSPTVSTTYWVDHSLAIQTTREYFNVVIGTEGCTDPSACNYDANAICDDGSCLTVYGCTDSISCNYNVLATCDDGSCIFNPSTVTTSSTCPGISEGVISLSVSPIISGVTYTYTINNGPITSYTNNTIFLSATNYNYEFFIDGISCGVETITINEYPAMTLQTNVFNSICDSSNASVSVTVPQIVFDTLADITAYCASSPLYSANICVIDSVVLVGDNSTINNLTPVQNGNYFDYTNLYTDVTLGQSYFLDVQLNSIYAPNISAGAKVYIDWNIDGDFTDPGEQIGVISNLALPNVMSIPIIVPLNATSGATLMRIVCNYNEDNSITSCNSSNFFQWGDVEDYTIVINSQASAVGLTYLWSPIGGNDSIANNLAAGIYTVTVMDVNGCIATETAIVGATLPVSVIANSDQTICNGGVPANLTAIGISSAGAYTWWPSSAFTNPNLQNPSFNSAVNTTTVYTVTFTDSNGCIANDSVIITVNPVPSVTLLGLPNPACLGDNIILTASASMPVNRYRFQYNSGIGWVNMSAPAFDVINPVTFFNITTTTNFRLKVREYNSCTNSSWSSIITVPISTIVTPPISHN